jgi:hypothetical protein
VWLVNEDCEEQLGKFHYSPQASTEVEPRVYTPAGAFGNPDPLLYGRPVIPVEQAPALGTVGDITLADLTQYSILQGPPQMALSVDVAFLTDETVFRFALRVDGKPLWASPITPYNGGSTRSPFVSLAAR